MRFPDSIIRFFAGLIVLSCAFSLVSATYSAGRVNVAYSSARGQIEWAGETADDGPSAEFNWMPFASGNDISAAMGGGVADIGYSHGIISFVIAVSNGLPIKIVGIAGSHAEANNCVVHKDSPLDRSDANSIARSLKGKKVATTVNNITHYKFLKTLSHYGLSPRDVIIVPMLGDADASTAFMTGQVDVGCAFGAPLDKMRDHGRVIMTSTEQEKAGILAFDVISVTDKFAAENEDRLVAFLQDAEDWNNRLAADKNSHWDIPAKDEQLSRSWMDGRVMDFAKDTADFLVERGVMPKALDDYGAVVDASFLAQVE